MTENNNYNNQNNNNKNNNNSSQQENKNLNSNSNNNFQKKPTFSQNYYRSSNNNNQSNNSNFNSQQKNDKMAQAISSNTTQSAIIKRENYNNRFQNNNLNNRNISTLSSNENKNQENSNNPQNNNLNNLNRINFSQRPKNFNYPRNNNYSRINSASNNSEVNKNNNPNSSETTQKNNYTSNFSSNNSSVRNSFSSTRNYPTRTLTQNNNQSSNSSENKTNNYQKSNYSNSYQQNYNNYSSRGEQRQNFSKNPQNFERRKFVSKGDESGFVVNSKSLIDAGAQYGHKKAFWNPKMKEYIHGKKGQIHILDMEKSAKMFNEVYNKVKEITARGEKFLFVGTKPNAKEIIKTQATRAGAFYVTERWLGGSLTNLKTLKKTIMKMREYEIAHFTGKWNLLTKKESTKLEKERIKLQAYFGGVKDMHKLPGAIFVCDTNIEHNAIKEARKLRIPVFAFADSNCDISMIDYPIIANDDGKNSILLITTLIADAICEVNGQETIYAHKDQIEFEKPEDSLYVRKEEKRDKNKNPNYKGKNPKFGPNAKKSTLNKNKTFKSRANKSENSTSTKVNEVTTSIVENLNQNNNQQGENN